MKKRQHRPMQKACGLNSESKEGVTQAKVSGAGPERGQRRVERGLHPQCKGEFEAGELRSRWGGDADPFAFLEGQAVRG